MKASDIEWRIEQIACTILYRCFDNISIDKTPDWGLLDLLVRFNDGTDLKFGVIVKKAFDNLPNSIDRLVNMLNKVDYTQAVNQIPIVLLAVDEPTESAKIAFLVGWRFGKPRIYKNFELRNLNQKTADICLQIIKSMDDVIRILSVDDLNVLKKITFSKKLADNRVQQAEVLYLRKLSSTYRMSQKEVVEEKERFERLLKGTPEEDYPQDELDELILESVKKQFKNAKVRSKLMLLSTELDDLQSYRDVHCVHTNLLVSPDLTSLPEIALSMLDGLELFSVGIDIFVENIFYQEAFDGVSFEKEEPLEGWLKKVTEWNRLKGTMRSITEYFR